MELLYESIMNLSDKDLIEIHPNLRPQLLAESTKWRDK